MFDNLAPFNGDGVLVSTIRLVLGGVALIHFLLCVRVVGMRAWRYARREENPNLIERVPTASMIAYGAFTFNTARALLYRIPGAPDPVIEAFIAYGVALIAGTWAFTQIVYLKRRDSKRLRRR